MSAALSFVTIPPTAVALVVPLACDFTESSIFLTVLMILPEPFMSISPGAVDKIIRRADFENAATSELSTSLSPNFIYSPAALMQSFSLIIGTIPLSRSSSSRSRIALWRGRRSRSSRVSRICATHSPHDSNSSDHV